MEYTVDVDKIIVLCGHVTVEAKDEDEARTKAYQEAEQGNMSFKFGSVEFDAWTVEETNPVPWSERGKALIPGPNVGEHQ